MELDYTPKERLDKIVEILAEGVLSMIRNGYCVISFLSIADLRSDINIEEVIKIRIVQLPVPN